MSNDPKLRHSNRESNTPNKAVDVVKVTYNSGVASIPKSTIVRVSNSIFSNALKGNFPKTNK